MNNTESQTSFSPIVPYAWVILGVVYLASIAAPVNQLKAPPILPVLMQTYQINLTQAGLLMSVVSLVGLVLALPSSIILRRRGPRFTGMIALGFISIGSVLGALSGSYETLLGSRAVEGVGNVLMGIVAPATIAMWFPPARQGTPMGIWATWVPVGSLVMYLIAPGLAISVGWQAVWWVSAMYAFVMLIIYGLFVRQRPAQSEDLPTTIQAGEMWKSLVNRDIWLLGLTFACFTMVMISIGTYYPTYLNLVQGYTLGRSALISSITMIMILFSAPLAGFFSDRSSSRRLFISLPILLFGLLLLFPFRVTGWQIVVVIAVQGLVGGFIPTAVFTAAPAIMRKPQLAGMGLAVVLVGQNLGQLLGPVVFGELVTHIGWVYAGYSLILVCLIGFASSWLVRIR